jgi:hypothetical protein
MISRWCAMGSGSSVAQVLTGVAMAPVPLVSGVGYGRA